MFVDVMLIVAFQERTDDRCKSFSDAMLRRGWWKMEDRELAYRIGFNNAANDSEIVQICERDVRESAYVAGAGKFDATCLIAPDDSATGDIGWSDSGSHPDFC